MYIVGFILATLRDRRIRLYTQECHIHNVAYITYRATWYNMHLLWLALQVLRVIQDSCDSLILPSTCTVISLCPSSPLPRTLNCDDRTFPAQPPPPTRISGAVPTANNKNEGTYDRSAVCADLSRVMVCLHQIEIVTL